MVGNNCLEQHLESERKSPSGPRIESSATGNEGGGRATGVATMPGTACSNGCGAPRSGRGLPRSGSGQPRNGCGPIRDGGREFLWGADFAPPTLGRLTFEKSKIPPVFLRNPKIPGGIFKNPPRYFCISEKYRGGILKTKK